MLGSQRSVKTKQNQRSTRRIGATTTTAGQRFHRFATWLATTHTAANASPSPIAGHFAYASPPNEPSARSSAAAVWSPIGSPALGAPVVVVAATAGSAVSFACTTMRCRALRLGWHAVSVSRLSVVGAMTSVCVGFTLNQPGPCSRPIPGRGAITS